MGMQGEGKVVQVQNFPTMAARDKWLAGLGARYRKQDAVNGSPLYKTASGVVLRLASSQTVEVLSNCVC
jgi:hypothetical protein